MASGTFTAVDQGSSAIQVGMGERVTATFTGTWVGVVALQKSLGGAGWQNIQPLGRVSPFSVEWLNEPGSYRVACLLYTSGTIAYTLTSAPLITPTGTTTISQFAHVDVETGSLGSSFVDVPGLTFPIEANKKYAFEFQIQAYTDQTTTGIDVAVNGPASPISIRYTQPRFGATGVVTSVATVYDNDTASGTGPTAGTPGRVFTVFGIIENGPNAGTLAARIKREAVGTGPVVMPGSWGRVWELFT
jgi:hypothetical protein